MANSQKHVFLTVLLLLFIPLLLSAQWLETTIAVGDGPFALVHNPTNNKIYCANSGSDNVTVIDGATNAVITTIGVGAYPLAFT
jgi:YVTN family beta-propeller protein